MLLVVLEPSAIVSGSRAAEVQQIKGKKTQLTTVLTVIKLCEIALIYEDFCTDSLWN